VKPEEIDQARKVLKIVSVRTYTTSGTGSMKTLLQYCEAARTGLHSRFSRGCRQTGKTGRQIGPGSEVARIDLVSQLSLAWLLHRSPVMLPIPGTSSVAHLEENLKAARISLSAQDMKAIEEAAS
jgi:aryl-alcohol dehydrogenase-like predicted oxidoreductase